MDITEETAPVAKSKRTTLPRILDGTYFNELSVHPNDRIWANCTTLGCKIKLVKGSKTSTGNFKNHYRTNHNELIPELERYLDKKQKYEPMVKPTIAAQQQSSAPPIQKEEVVYSVEKTSDSKNLYIFDFILSDYSIVSKSNSFGKFIVPSRGISRIAVTIGINQ